MSEDSLFGDKPDTNKEEVQKTTEFVFTVGDREYNAESASKKILNADEHISNLEKENAEMRKKLLEATTLDAVLQSMNKNGEKPTAPTPAVDTPDIETLVERTINQRELQRTRTANVMQVDKLIKERYGEQAKTVLQQKLSSVGLDVNSAMEIAAKSPKAFMKMFDEGGSDPKPSVPNHGTQHTQNMGNDSIQEGTYAYYAKIRKDNPALYNSPTIQRKMLEDAERLGKEKFFS